MSEGTYPGENKEEHENIHTMIGLKLSILHIQKSAPSGVQEADKPSLKLLTFFSQYPEKKGTPEKWLLFIKSFFFCD